MSYRCFAAELIFAPARVDEWFRIAAVHLVMFGCCSNRDNNVYHIRCHVIFSYSM